METPPRAQTVFPARRRLSALLGIIATAVTSITLVLLPGCAAKSDDKIVTEKLPAAEAGATAKASARSYVRRQTSYDIKTGSPLPTAAATIINTEICIGGREYVQTVAVTNSNVVLPGGIFTTPTGQECD